MIGFAIVVFSRKHRAIHYISRDHKLLPLDADYIVCYHRANQVFQKECACRRLETSLKTLKKLFEPLPETVAESSKEVLHEEVVNYNTLENI